MAGGQSLARGIMSNWANFALNVGISFFLSPYVVNKLGSVYYGIWALTLQFTGYLYLFDSGIREGIIRYTSKYSARKQHSQLNAVLSTAAISYLPIIGLCILATLVCVWLAPGPFNIQGEYLGPLRMVVLLTGLTIAQSFVFGVFSGVLHGLRRFDAENGIAMVFSLLRVAAIVTALETGGGVVELALAQLLVAIASGCVAGWYALHLLARHDLPFRFALPKGRRLQAYRRRILGYGGYAMLHSIGQKIIFSSDAIIIGMLMTMQAVTSFSIPNTLIQYLRTLLASTAKVFMPASSALHARGEHEQLRALVLRGARLLTLIALPVATVLAVLGGEFVGLWIGKEYAATAGSLLLVLAVTQIVSAPSYSLVTLLYGISQHSRIAWLRLLEAVLNVTLSVILLKRFGLLGVALGVAAAHAIVVVGILPAVVCRIIRISVPQYFLNAYAWPIVAAIPLLVLTLAVKRYIVFENLLQFAAVVALLTIVYGMCVVAVGLDRGDRHELLRRLRLLRT